MIKRNMTIIIFSLIIIFSISSYKASAQDLSQLSYQQAKRALEITHRIQQVALEANQKKTTFALRALHAKQRSMLNAKYGISGANVDSGFDGFAGELNDRIEEWKRGQEEPAGIGDTITDRIAKWKRSRKGDTKGGGSFENELESKIEQWQKGGDSKYDSNADELKRKIEEWSKGLGGSKSVGGLNKPGERIKNAVEKAQRKRKIEKTGKKIKEAVEEIQKRRQER